MTPPMRLLLDTHVVLWLTMQPSKVPESVQRRVRTAESRVISAISVYEIAFKARIGKLPQGQAVIDAWDAVRVALAAREADLTASHLLRAGALDWEHRDPFDRMLVAQAQIEGLVLLTADDAIRGYSDVRSLWS